MTHKIQKQAKKLLSKYPNLTSKELASLLSIDERQAYKLIKNFPESNPKSNLENNLSSNPRNNLKNKSYIGDTIKGTISIHKDGYGFFRPDDKNIEDAFIHPKKLKGAGHNDICLCRIGMYKGKREAEVVKIIERGINALVGVVEKYKGKLYIIPFSKNFSGYIRVQNSAIALVDEDVVLCKIEKYPTYHSYAIGKVIEKIGRLRDKGIDNKIILHKYFIQTEFTEDVIEECEQITDSACQIDNKYIEDFRDIYTITIDGETARDFDDAISIFKKNDNYELYVHIADVSRYVRPDSAIDIEAQKRGTSIYFPEFAIPMLPEILSNNLCSLVPCEDRYTVTCKMVFDKLGNKKEVKFYRSIINSNYRLTYNYVNEVFSGNKKCDDENLKSLLFTAKELTELLIIKREESGVVEFEQPEAEFSFDNDGNVIDIAPRQRGLSERLIECFMIAANESVAEYFEKHKITGVYRVHSKPSVKKIEDWLTIARNFGLQVPVISYPITSDDVAELSKIASKSKQSDLLSSLLIRAMMRAEYTTKNEGHFGLSSYAYTHFTSPIRRYPDLLVHRILLSSLHLGEKQEEDHKLATLASHSSQRERVAQDAEHDISTFKKLEYISNNYDSVFDGYINRITDKGIFIYVEKLMMTGFIDYIYIDFDNMYKYGEYALCDATGERYRVGDKIRVTPYKVDIATLQADFTIYKKRGKKK